MVTIQNFGPPCRKRQWRFPESCPLLCEHLRERRRAREEALHLAPDGGVVHTPDANLFGDLAGDVPANDIRGTLRCGRVSAEQQREPVENLMQPLVA